jgi:hypothetical protein
MTTTEDENLSRLLRTGEGQDPPNRYGWASPNVPLPPCPDCNEPLDDLSCDGLLHRLAWMRPDDRPPLPPLTPLSAEGLRARM